MMYSKFFESHSPKKTLAIAQQFSKVLTNGNVIALTGDLGTGKTLFVRGICNGLGYTGNVSSPSYLHLNVYAFEPMIYHADIYLAKSPNDVFDLGLDDLVLYDGILVVEWAQLYPDVLPRIDYEVALKWGQDSEYHRVITIEKR